MQTEMVVIRDSKADCYNNPWYTRTLGEAERNFRELVNDKETLVGKYPEDYDLYKIGTYDQKNGTITVLDTPQHVCKGVSLVRQS